MVIGCVGTSYVLRVELPVQRRLCPIFVRDVGSPDIHECFRRLTGKFIFYGKFIYQSFAARGACGAGE